MTHVRRCLAVASILAFTPSAARAAPSEYTAIRVDDGVVYVDVSCKDGASAGQALEVVARDNANEPVHVGWVVLDSCGDAVSIARVPAELRGQIRKGTLFRVPPPPPPAPVPPPAIAPVPPAPPAPPAPPPPAPRKTHATALFHHEPPTLVPPGVPLALSVYAPAPLANPSLMYRLAGERIYTVVPFEAKPDAYYVAKVPLAAVQAPGIEYYIVVDSPDAPRELAYATPEQPNKVSVEGRFNETNELARYGVRDEVSTMTELVSYRSPKGSDYYYRLEGEYLHRIFKAVYSMRFGAGYLNGQTIDDSGMPTNVGFLYAYSESEFRSASFPIAFIPRVIFGVNNSGVGGGVEARLRLGDELGMNFEAGVTVLSYLGFETFTMLAVHPSPRLKLALAAYLENLPLATQLGFRSYVDVRYRFQHATSVIARVGVAARSIDAIGPDAGLGFALGF
jgi:hypothetical protein